MTSNKAQKTAARQRMAQTGEPYSVARRAVSAGDPDPDEAPAPEAAGTEPSLPSPQEQYAEEARAAGVPAAEINAQFATFRQQEAAGLHAQETAGLARRAAERAREQADWLEEAAERTEERANLAQESAELAQEWADEHEQERAVERAASYVRRPSRPGNGPSGPQRPLTGPSSRPTWPGRPPTWPGITPARLASPGTTTKERGRQKPVTRGAGTRGARACTGRRGHPGRHARRSHLGRPARTGNADTVGHPGPGGRAPDATMAE